MVLCSPLTLVGAIVAQTRRRSTVGVKVWRRSERQDDEPTFSFLLSNDEICCAAVPTQPLQDTLPILYHFLPQHITTSSNPRESA